ncbi:general secretion pathway protein GspK [Nannocystis pusilla]|uniref:general secretion pathway protein GspK n=1 Tax=Nannocystis pusilla TaxID=889268 RepID=UPI003DA3B132
MTAHADTAKPKPHVRPARSGAARRRGGGKEHGIALLMVLACIAVLLPFTAAFSYTTRVDWQAAVNLRDEISARNLTRGGMRLSLLLFELQRMVFNQKQFRQMLGTWDITQVAPYLMSAFGSKDGHEAISGLVGLDNSTFKDLAIDHGGFEIRVEAESGKLNVNCLAGTGQGKDNPQARTVETLEAMLMPTLYDPLFDEEKGDGQRYTRANVIKAIVDYIDEDNKAWDMVKLASSSTQERYRYTEIFDPYQPRNARIDSVEELHLVQGVDDDLMTAIAADLTVYGGCKVNLNFASADQIALVLRHSVTEEDKWKTEGENFLIKTLPLARYVVDTRTMSLFADMKAFKEFVEKPDKFMNPLAALGGGGAAGQALNRANLPRIPEGMTIRENSEEDKSSGEQLGGLSDIATIAPERVYRIEIIAEVGAVKKRLTAIYDMQFVRSEGAKGTGAWLYLRED